LESGTTSETLPPLVICRFAATKPISGIQVKFQKSSHRLEKIHVMKPGGKQTRAAPSAYSIRISTGNEQRGASYPEDKKYQQFKQSLIIG
jgi:hypothetical protein